VDNEATAFHNDPLFSSIVFTPLTRGQVIERREELRFTLKPSDAIRVV